MKLRFGALRCMLNKLYIRRRRVLVLLFVVSYILFTLFLIKDQIQQPQPPTEPELHYTPAAPLVYLANDSENGNYALEEPFLLPGLKIKRPRTYNEEELLERYRNMTFIYTYANGTEPRHVYRRTFVAMCAAKIRKAEQHLYNLTESKTGKFTVYSMVRCWPEALLFSQGIPRRYNSNGINRNYTNRDIYRQVLSKAKPVFTDVDSGELRYSLRSLELNVKWHTGPLVLISPGHFPESIDSAHHFLAQKCAAKNFYNVPHGARRSITVLHQDALLPYGLRQTSNTYFIELFLHRIKNITPIHLYINDDYFINQPVAITDLVNSRGGPILRVESGFLKPPKYPAAAFQTKWITNVRRNHMFLIHELDVVKEDYLPPTLIEEWEKRGVLDGDGDALHLDKETLLDWAHHPSLDPLPIVYMNDSRRHRRYVTHAPFVYCTNMFEQFVTRYVREIAQDSLISRQRNAWSFNPPLVYFYFMMARPWVASPKFFPYLVEKMKAERKGIQSPPKQTILLDNHDGCAPATLLSGKKRSKVTFLEFWENTTRNQKSFDAALQTNPLFFNINGKFTSPAVARQVKNILERKFPHPFFLESKQRWEFTPKEENIHRLFEKIMNLPVILISNYRDDICPLVRSLEFALPRHTGKVQVLFNKEERSASHLIRLRREMQYHLCSVIPVLKCKFNQNVKLAGIDFKDDNALPRTVERFPTKVKLPSHCDPDGIARSVKAIVIDTRIKREGPPRSWIRSAIAIPGQVLSLADFEVVTLFSGDTVLQLRRTLDSKTYWITGACEPDLLYSFPIPYPRCENMSAEAEFI